jgi:flagellar P-ring protein FlgI
MGDARSLYGGTLVMTPLLGADRQPYAIAQGQVSNDSFRFEQNGSLAQKGHPTTATVSDGGLAQRTLEARVTPHDSGIDLLLNEPDYTTAARIAAAVEGRGGGIRATVQDAGRVRLVLPDTTQAGVTAAMALIEGATIEPDVRARVVVNERTGTVVAGGDVSISAVTVSQGDIRVAISQRNLVSQPGGVIVGTNPGIQTAVVPQSRVVVSETEARAVTLAQGSSVADLVAALRAIRASSQDVVAVLQGIKRAGALHAELVVQ